MLSPTCVDDCYIIYKVTNIRTSGARPYGVVCVSTNKHMVGDYDIMYKVKNKRTSDARPYIVIYLYNLEKNNG